MSKLPCANTMIFKKYPPLKSGPPEISVIQREFRTNEGDDDFATHPPITVDRIVMDVCPKAGNGNTGLPTGAPAVIDNVLQTIDFAYVGVISELYRNGLDYFSGIIANVKYYLGGVLIHTWDIAKEALSEIDLIAGTLLTFVNSSPSNWGLFDKTATGWIGQELVVNGGFDSGVADWVASNAAISIIDGNMVVDDSAGAGGDSRAYQSILAPMISSYRLRVDNISTSSLSFIYIGDGGSFNNIQYTGVAIPVPSMYEVEFSTSSAGIQISLAVGGNGVSVFGNVSVKQVLKNA